MKVLIYSTLQMTQLVHFRFKLEIRIKVTLKAFDAFKNKQKSVWINAFLICKSMYILKVYWVHYTWHKSNILKKFPSEKINVTKNIIFFLSRAPPHQSFTYDSRFLHELKQKVYVSKIVCGIFHFCFRLIFIKIYIFRKNIFTCLLLL